MSSIGFFAGICALLVCGSAVAPSSTQTQSANATPLILEKDEGERRVWRPIEGRREGHYADKGRGCGDPSEARPRRDLQGTLKFSRIH